MDDYKKYVPNVHFEQIPIKNLVSSQKYQRGLSRANIQKAAADFNVYQINPVKVSRRDGINYVFNGQHTIEIVALVSGSRETPVWCMIYDDLNYEHEADIFANQMKYVKNLQPLEIFNANIEAKNEEQLIIKDLVESYGLKIGGKKEPGDIYAVSALQNIFRKYNYHVLDRTLSIIIATWEGDSYSFSANILNAVAKLIVTYKEELDDEIFKDRLGSISIRQLIREAKDFHAGSLGFAEAMVIEYNGKKKNAENKLSIGKLIKRQLMVYDDAENDNEEYIPDDSNAIQEFEQKEIDFNIQPTEDDDINTIETSTNNDTTDN